MTEEVYYIEDHPYQDQICVVFTDDIDESITRQCERLNISTKRLIGGPTASACVCRIDRKTKDKKNHIQATWALFDVNKVRPDIIVHECVHLAHELTYKRGLHHTPETDEALAYLTQWLFKKISDYYAEYKTSIKKSKKSSDITK